MTFKKIVKSISLDNHIPVKDVEEMIACQFKLIKKTMESATKNKEETFKHVTLPLFGMFVVPKGKIAILAKIARDRKLNKNKNK